jgi:hypothetical protein
MTNTKHYFDIDKLISDLSTGLVLLIPGIIFGVYAYSQKFLHYTNYSSLELSLLILTSILVTFLFWVFAVASYEVLDAAATRYVKCEEVEKESQEESRND